MKRNFTLEYWHDDEWFVGRLKEVPGVFSQGKSLYELEQNIRDAYKMMQESEKPPRLSAKTHKRELTINV
ncbi:MAG TPA: type II toxin-antitoxin system HicB family antitoxin [bacterium]